MGLKDWVKDAPVANYGQYVLRPNHEVEKLSGEDKGRHSLDGLTIELEDGSELSKRITVTRMLATGLFAFALKKSKGGEKWLLIAGPDFEWFEEVHRKKQTAAMKFVQALRKSQRELAR